LALAVAGLLVVGLLVVESSAGNDTAKGFDASQCCSCAAGWESITSYDNCKTAAATKSNLNEGNRRRAEFSSNDYGYGCIILGSSGSEWYFNSKTDTTAPADKADQKSLCKPSSPTAAPTAPPTASPTTAPTVWKKGFDTTGATIAIDFESSSSTLMKNCSSVSLTLAQVTHQATLPDLATTPYTCVNTGPSGSGAVSGVNMATSYNFVMCPIKDGCATCPKDFPYPSQHFFNTSASATSTFGTLLNTHPVQCRKTPNGRISCHPGDQLASTFNPAVTGLSCMSASHKSWWLDMPGNSNDFMVTCTVIKHVRCNAVQSDGKQKCGSVKMVLPETVQQCANDAACESGGSPTATYSVGTSPLPDIIQNSKLVQDGHGICSGVAVSS